MPLQIVPGKPPLLVGDWQIYEWRADGIVAKPRLLAEAFSQQDLDAQTGFPTQLQGSYPDQLYVQIMRAGANEPSWRRRLLKWSQNRWQKLTGPLADSPDTVVVLEPGQGVLAVGCVSERCFFQPLGGKPLVPRFASHAGCSTRISSVLDAEIDDTGTVHVLGNECATGRVLLERWPKGATKSSVEVVSTAEPRPEGFDPLDVGLGVFDGEAWIWGLEWFWGGGPVTQRLLTHRAGGTWPLEELPCDSPKVVGFSVWRGYQMAVCHELLMRHSGQDWVVAKPNVVDLQLFEGMLLLSDSDGLWQFDPPGVDETLPKLSFALPCAGYYVDLGIDKDFARARKLLAPLGPLRRELVLATGSDQGSVFLLAPDQELAFAAAKELTLQNEPACMTNDLFQTFVTAD